MAKQVKKVATATPSPITITKGGGRAVVVTTNPDKNKAIKAILKDFKEHGLIAANQEEVKKGIKSNAIDEFSNDYKSTKEISKSENRDNLILKPSIALSFLNDLVYKNNIILQCIDVYAANIEGLGASFQYIGPTEDELGKNGVTKKETEDELARLKDLIECPNGEYGDIELRKRVRKCRESVGFGCIEVQRDYSLLKAGESTIVAYRHVPAKNIRKTTKDKEPVIIKKKVNRGGKEFELEYERYFKRYVQKINDKLIWFKEFGDPRHIDCTTGKPMGDKNIDYSRLATELIEIGDYNSSTAYYLPRYINQLPSILGSRESEELNYRFFENDGIPYMVVMVSGGTLTEESVKKIQDRFHSYNPKEDGQMLIIEAEPTSVRTEKDVKFTTPKVEIKPLGKDKQSDEQFANYDASCRKKIQSSFRVPNLMLGLADDYNRATAYAALYMAESQVFQPEREAMDAIYNSTLLVDGQGYPPKYWKYVSNSMKLVNKDDMIKAFEVCKDTGAVTPNVAIEFFNEIFNWDTPRIDEEWGNLPFKLLEDLVAKNENMPEESKAAIAGLQLSMANLFTSKKDTSAK